MARTATLSELRTGAYRRADQENLTERFPTSEVTGYVNDGIAELWDMLVNANGYSYYGITSTINLVAGTSSYSLPADFYKLHKVIYVGSTLGGRLELDRLSEADEVALQVATSRVPLYYRVRSGFLDVLPRPATSASLSLSYVPCATKLVSDNDTFDGINGFEEYVVCYAARRMSIKDADFELANMIYQDMNRQIERIERMAADRDKGHPERVQDIRGAISWRRPKRLWLTRQ